MSSLDLDRAVERFAETPDFTVGVEEEFSILDPHTLELVPRFEELRDAAQTERLLAEGITGELISSEIEIISGVGVDLADALARQRERRKLLFALAGAHGVALGATGTHPWADYREQPIIDTEHYRRVEEGLKYVAWRNNTFSLHVHLGVRGLDRAVRVCDRLRPVLPLLLALSANSPYLDASVVLRVDYRLLAVVGPGMGSGRAERYPVGFGQREQALAALALAGERIVEIGANAGDDLDLR